VGSLGVGVPPGGLPRRRLNHQMIAPPTTRAARIPNAIQPHCVLLVDSSLLLDAAAAPTAAAPTTAGLAPDSVVEVVVEAALVAGAASTTVVVSVLVSVFVTVTVDGEGRSVVAGTPAVDEGSVGEVSVDAVGAVEVVGGLVGAVRVPEPVSVPIADPFPPPPHAERAKAAKNPTLAAATRRQAFTAAEPLIPPS
jgi:hypothetical protein